jgi:SpoVK/Ycf46/Vps4 family AAA+-type ATPase
MSEVKKTNTTDLKSFNYLENGDISFSMLDTIKTVKQLDSGVYLLNYLGHPDYRIDLKLTTDQESIKMYDFDERQVLEDLFNVFFNEDVIKKMASLGFNHKAGILLYGKEGTGKTTIIKHYANKVVDEHNALVFYLSNASYLKELWSFIVKVRAIQDNPIVIIMEEMDSFIHDKKEGYLKVMFDGHESIDNCLFMGTTNYIDSIPAAMKNRPSRFKYVMEIDGINKEDVIFDILTSMIGDMFEPTEIVDFARELKGSTLDFIKQFALDKIMNLDSYKKSKKAIGFTV